MKGEGARARPGTSLHGSPRDHVCTIMSVGAICCVEGEWEELLSKAARPGGKAEAM